MKGLNLSCRNVMIRTLGRSVMMEAARCHKEGDFSWYITVNDFTILSGESRGAERGRRELRNTEGKEGHSCKNKATRRGEGYTTAWSLGTESDWNDFLHFLLARLLAVTMRIFGPTGLDLLFELAIMTRLGLGMVVMLL
jgi:hypothetical protein